MQSCFFFYLGMNVIHVLCYFIYQNTFCSDKNIIIVVNTGCDFSNARFQWVEFRNGLNLTLVTIPNTVRPLASIVSMLLVSSCQNVNIPSTRIRIAASICLGPSKLLVVLVQVSDQQTNAVNSDSD